MKDFGIYNKRVSSCCKDRSILGTQHENEPLPSYASCVRSDGLKVDLPSTDCLLSQLQHGKLLGPGEKSQNCAHKDSAENSNTGDEGLLWFKRSPCSTVTKESLAHQLSLSKIPYNNQGTVTLPTSKDLQHEQSNFINVLPDIDEGGEINYGKNSSGKFVTSCNPAQAAVLKNGKRIQDRITSYANNLFWFLDSNEQRRVAGLVEIFQARGMIGPGLVPGIQRTPKVTHDPFIMGDLPTSSSSSLSGINTEESSLFGERLKRVGKAGGK